MEYIVRYGETIRMIAQRELGNAELWIDIAELNNLSYPYISEDGIEGTVSQGSVIKLPTQTDMDMKMEESLGTDLRLSTDKVNLSYDKGGDLSVGVDGDYQLVSEMSCLKQDITHRKMTPLGSLTYHSDYGSTIVSMIGSKKDDNWKIKAMLEIERAMRCDPRITDVKEIQVDNLPTGIKIDYTASAKGIIFKPGGIQDEEI